MLTTDSQSCCTLAPNTRLSPKEEKAYSVTKTGPILYDAKEERNWSYVGICAGNTHTCEDNPGAVMAADGLMKMSYGAGS